MKNALYVLAGVTVAAAYILISRQRTPRSVNVDALAHTLQEAWADHHTVV